MDRDEFRAIVERVKADRPVWFGLPSDEPPDEDQLRAVEQSLGARLPDDYTWFLREYGGGDFAFVRVLSADPGSDLAITAQQWDELPDGVIAFSPNGTGDMYVFPVESGVAQDRVLFFDHETGELSPSEPDFLTFVSRNAFGDAG